MVSKINKKKVGNNTHFSNVKRDRSVVDTISPNIFSEPNSIIQEVTREQTDSYYLESGKSTNHLLKLKKAPKVRTKFYSNNSNRVE
jgi:agmatine/peptidylarginine deiminase